jgi:uncharacterized protein (DUF302 family)
MRIEFISTSFIIIATITTTAYAANSNGMIKIKSSHSVPETINKLENVLNEKGMTIFKRVDHADGARKAGMHLRPTELLIFGNPRVGTPLMLCSHSAALDLPQKALAYEDENGQVWLAYNDPAYISQRHNMKDCEKALQKVSNALANFSRTATR